MNKEAIFVIKVDKPKKQSMRDFTCWLRDRAYEKGRGGFAMTTGWAVPIDNPGYEKVLVFSIPDEDFSEDIVAKFREVFENGFVGGGICVMFIYLDGIYCRRAFFRKDCKGCREFVTEVV